MTSSPSSLTAPAQVYFSCVAAAANEAYRIDFGDGDFINTTAKDIIGCTNSIPRHCWHNVLVEGHHSFTAPGLYEISVVSASGTKHVIPVLVK